MIIKKPRLCGVGCLNFNYGLKFTKQTNPATGGKVKIIKIIGLS